MRQTIKDTVQAMKYLEHLEKFDPTTRYSRMAEVASRIPETSDPDQISDEELAAILIEMLITKYKKDIYAFNRAH